MPNGSPIPLAACLPYLALAALARPVWPCKTARQELHNYQHGIFFVALAPLSSPQFIISTIAETINFAFYNIQEDNKVQLINYLRNKNMLLLLDNFEHLINTADLVAEILQEAPDVKFFVSITASG